MSNSPMPLCPRCGNEPLQRYKVATGGIAYQCQRCHGTQMSLAVLRGRSETLVPQLWADANANPRPGIACPLCRRPSSALMADGVELDLCRPCQSLWFDADELQRFPVRKVSRPTETIGSTSVARIDPDTEDEGYTIIAVVDVLFQVLTSWAADS